MTDKLTFRFPEQVDIGGITLFCEKFRAVMNAVLSESSTVDGGNCITARSRRAAKLILTGRLPSTDESIAAIGRLNNMTGDGELTVSYRGLNFAECVLLGYSAEDRGDFISLTVIISAPAPVQFEEV